MHEQSCTYRAVLGKFAVVYARTRFFNIWKFLKSRSLKSAAISPLRNLITRLHLKFLPKLRKKTMKTSHFMDDRNNLTFYHTKRLLVEAYKSYDRCNTNVLNDLVMLKQPSYCLRKYMNIELPSPKSEIGRLTFRQRRHCMEFTS